MLDPLLDGNVEDDLGRDALILRGYSAPDLDRVLALVGRAVHKRRQAPPGVQDQARAVPQRTPAAGCHIRPGTHRTAPVMLYDAKFAQQFAKDLLAEGIYVIGFFYPVVPQGQARIRTQMSAAHTREQIDQAVAAFVKVGKKLGVIG